MDQTLQTFITGANGFFIRQKKELTEILIDWETANKYDVLTPEKQEVGFLVERAQGLGAFFRRGILRSHRGFEMDLLGRDGSRILALSRRFFFLFSTLNVTDSSGKVLGQVRRRFGFLHKKYDLVDSEDRCFGRIESPIWRLWTFPVKGTSAVITKRWNGMLKEVFTDSDTFQLDFGAEQWTAAQRAVIFAAAISIDFDFFENNQGSQGILRSSRN